MPTGLNASGRTVSGLTGACSYKQFAIQDNYGTAIGNGDPVVLSSGYIIACAESAKPDGILRGIIYINAAGEPVFMNSYPANTTNSGAIDGVTDVVAIVEPVQQQTFYIDVADAAFTQADVGTNKRLKSTGRDAVTGRSTAVVDMDATITSEVRLVKLLGLAPTQGNAFGATAVAEVAFVL